MLKGISDYVNSATSNLRREAVAKSDGEGNNIVIEDSYQENGKEGDDLSMTDLAKTAAAGAGLGITAANSGKLKELTKRVAALEAQKSSNPSNKGAEDKKSLPEPALTKREKQAMDWLKNKAFWGELKSVDPGLDFLRGMAGLMAGSFAVYFASLAACPLAPAIAIAAAATAAPVVLGHINAASNEKGRVGSKALNILQSYSEKESLPRLAKNYGEYIKSEKDRKLFYGE